MLSPVSKIQPVGPILIDALFYLNEEAMMNAIRILKLVTRTSHTSQLLMVPRANLN